MGSVLLSALSNFNIGIVFWFSGEFVKHFFTQGLTNNLFFSTSKISYSKGAVD
jgi:hypothetical protein